MEQGRKQGFHRLLRQPEGKGHYARVSVSVTEDADAPGIAVAASAFDWMKGTHGPGTVLPRPESGFGDAAIRGAAYALDHLPDGVLASPLQIQIDRIEIMPADTTLDDIAYAACFAVWDALGTKGAAQPYLEHGVIVFPDE